MDPMDIAELKEELEKLHGSSYGWAVSCCRRDREEAEEVLQTVYLKILEGKAQFRGESSFKTWLFAVIRKTAIGEYRKSLLRKLRLIPSSERSAERVTTTEAPSAALEKSETQQRFELALKQLAARQREVLHLVFYEDLNLREAAEVMGVSIGSARQHYDRGKKRMRETLEQTEVAYGINWRRRENPGAVS
jgi:RNA polymerase sigma-70 factor, ECF subfamily